MAISLPLAPPALGPASEYFEIDRVDYSTSAGGRSSGVTAGFPLWRCRWTLGRAIGRETSEEWRAFHASLRGVQRPFFAYEYARPYPLMTPRGFAGLTRAGGGAFAGAATTWSVNVERDVITLSGLPAGFVLSLTDYIMWRWTGDDLPGLGIQRRALCRVVQPAVANASGVISVSVEPPLPTLTPGAAVADLAKPHCVMKLDTSQTQIGEKGRTLRIDGQIAGLQDLRP